MSSTPEQLKCITTLQQPDCEFLSIEAVSGSGKTYLLTEIAKALKPSNGLYIAYSKAIATEASKKFPSSITCSTTHSLAYQNTVRPFGLRVGFFGYRDIQVRMPFEKKILVVESLKDYCLSRFVSIDEYIKDRQLKYDIAEPLKKYLGLMKQGTIDSTHDFYLKYYHILLSSGSIKHDNFDLIMLDEAGDLNEVTLEIFKLLPATKKVMVGDPCMPGETKVNTSTGWRRLDSIVKDLESNKQVLVRSYNKKDQKFEFKNALNPIRSGIKQCYLVKTIRGSVECTSNHKILTSKGYVRTDELKTGDIILKDNDKKLQNTKHQVNADQYQLLIGSFLGDGHIDYQDKLKQSARLTITHSEHQLEYLTWKANAFNSTAKKTQESKSHFINNSKCITSAQYTAQSKLFVLERTISIEAVRDIDALGLAIWVQDDGSLRNKYNADNKKLSITIDSNSFTYNEHLTLQRILLNNFNLEASIQKTKQYYRLSFNKENSLLLLSIINPYISDSFVGKFKHESSIVRNLDKSTPAHAADVLLKVVPTGRKETYDIEVEDNHNFIASKTAQKQTACGIIVHNCQNIFQFNKTINGFRAMANEGIHLPLSQSFRVDSNIAKLIQGFCREFMDPKMVFKGIDFTSEQRANIKTTAFISRTNGTLISEMIKLNQLGKPYGLTRPAKSIFELPLGLISLNKTGTIKLPQYKHLEEDYRDYHNNERLQEKSFYGYLSELHSDDISIKTALGAIMKHGPKSIIETFEKAKSHEGGNQNHTLCTSHSSKGLEWDSVYIADDIAEKIKKIIESKKFRNQGIEGLEPEEIGEMNLAYVSFSRAKYELLNAKAIYWTADMDFEEDEFNQQFYDYADTLF